MNQFLVSLAPNPLQLHAWCHFVGLAQWPWRVHASSVNNLSYLATSSSGHDASILLPFSRASSVCASSSHLTFPSSANVSCSTSPPMLALFARPQLWHKHLLPSCSCDLALSGTTSSNGATTFQWYNFLLTQLWGRACTYVALRVHISSSPSNNFGASSQFQAITIHAWALFPSYVLSKNLLLPLKVFFMNSSLTRCKLHFAQPLGASSFLCLVFFQAQLLLEQHVGSSTFSRVLF